MFNSQESSMDFNSQNYHTSVSQRLDQPSSVGQMFSGGMDAKNNNNNDGLVADLTDAFANAVIKASVLMSGGDEVGRESHINASQLAAAASQSQQNGGSTGISQISAMSPTTTKLSPYELALARYCDGTWHTQQYLSSYSNDERRRHALLASQSFTQSLDTDPNFAYSHYGTSLMNLLEKNYQAAFSNARMALLKMGRHCPNHVRFVLGISALRLDRNDIAVKCFDRISALSGDRDPLGHIGNFLTSVRRKDIVGIAEALLRLQDALPQLPLELIQKSADMIFLQCWPTPEEKRNDEVNASNGKKKSENRNFNANVIRHRIQQVSSSLFDIIQSSRNHPSCTPELAAYADFQEGRLRAALAISAGSERAPGVVDKDEMTTAQRLLYRASKYVIPALPHLVRATYHSLGKEAALVSALQGFNRISKQGLVPFRELYELVTVLLLLNNQPEGAVRIAKQMIDTIGVANSEAWFNASFVNRLDQRNSCEQSKQAVSIEETVKDGAAAAGASIVCTSGEEESKVRTNIASLSTHQHFQGDEDPKNPLNMLYRAADAFSNYENDDDDDTNLSIDLRKYLSADPNVFPREAPNAQLIPLVYNFAIMNEALGKKIEAVRIYTALIKWFPQEQAPYFRLANIALDNKDVATCIRWMQVCIAVTDPADKAQCYSMMARALASPHVGASGNAAAYKLLTSAEGKAVLEASNHRQQAVLYCCSAACLAHDAQGGQHVQMKAGVALRLFRQALKLDPESTAAAHGIACCVALLGASEQSSTILERIISEQTPDAGITRLAAENLFNAYINTTAYRQALRMEQVRRTAYPNAIVPRDRLNSIICAYSLSNHFKEAVDRAVHLVQENPRHALTNFTAILVVMSFVLSSIESMNMPKTEEEANKMATLLDSCLRWAGYANQLKDRPDATAFIRHLVAYIRKLDLKSVIQKFVVRTNRLEEETARWQDAWRHENTERTRRAEEEARKKEEEALRRREEEEELMMRRRQALEQGQADGYNYSNYGYNENNISQEDSFTQDMLKTQQLRQGGLMVGGGGASQQGGMMMQGLNAGGDANAMMMMAGDGAGGTFYSEAELQAMIANEQRQNLQRGGGMTTSGAEEQPQDDPIAGFMNPFDQPQRASGGTRRQREEGEEGEDVNDNNNSNSVDQQQQDQPGGSSNDGSLGDEVNQLVEAAQQQQQQQNQQ